MKLDVSILRYLNRDDFRVLAAVETGMRNHDLVPTELIANIAGLKGGGAHKVLGNLLRNKLVYHESKVYDGYRLTYSGFDFLALKALLQRGVITGVGRQIGVGKESDIYIVVNEEGEEMALKLQRLGRVSFRAIKKKRDYLAHRKSASWLYMSKLGAMKEYAFMKALHDAGFPTPTPIAHNRHAVVMSLIQGKTLVSLRGFDGCDASVVYGQALDVALRLADHGLIHCDLNEFNLLADPMTGKLTVIDFPQMVSTSHPNAEELFDRDVGCIVTYFQKRYGYTPPTFPTFASLPTKANSLDQVIEASGFSKKQSELLDQMLQEQQREDAAAAAADGDDDDNDDGEEEEEAGQEAGRHGVEVGDGSSATLAQAGAAASEAGVQQQYHSLAADVLNDREAAAADGDDAGDDAVGDMSAAAAGAATSSATSGAGDADAHLPQADRPDDTEDDDDDDDDGGAIDEASNEDDDEEDGSDSGSGSGEDDESPAARLARQREAALALEAQRVPDGVRTRASGRRVKQRGGEAYLHRNKDGGDGETAAGGGSRGDRRRAAARDGDGASVATGMTTGTVFEAVGDKAGIKSRVRYGLVKERSRSEAAQAVAKAYKGKNIMKGKEKVEANRMAKSHGAGEIVW